MGWTWRVAHYVTLEAPNQWAGHGGGGDADQLWNPQTTLMGWLQWQVRRLTLERQDWAGHVGGIRKLDLEPPDWWAGHRGWNASA